MKHGIAGLGSPWRALFSVEPVLQGLGFFHYTAWMLKVVRTGLAGLQTREGRAGKRRLECGHAGLRAESVHLRPEKHVYLCEARGAARHLTAASVLSGNQPIDCSPSLPPSSPSLSTCLFAPHLTWRPQTAPITFCLFRRVQFFQSKSWICLAEPMMVTTEDRWVTNSVGAVPLGPRPMGSSGWKCCPEHLPLSLLCLSLGD